MRAKTVQQENIQHCVALDTNPSPDGAPYAEAKIKTYILKRNGQTIYNKLQ